MTRAPIVGVTSVAFDIYDRIGTPTAYAIIRGDRFVFLPVIDAHVRVVPVLRADDL